MVELKSFIKSLKVLKNTTTIRYWWVEGISFDTFLKDIFVWWRLCGELSSHLQNLFWKDLMQVWSEFCEAVPVEKIKQILICSLWHNDRIGNGQLFIRNWCDMGIRVIYDLISEEGALYSFGLLKANYSIRDTLLDYQHVLNNISQVWKDQINMNRVFIVETKQHVVCNIYLLYLSKSKKGSRIFYDILVGVNEYILRAKWQAEMGDIGEEAWIMYYRTLKIFHETKLRDFQ